MFIHNLFEDVPALNNFLNLIEPVEIIAEVKLDGRYHPLPESNKINRILNQESEFDQNLLKRILEQYIIFGSVYIYKVKSRKAMMAEADGTLQDVLYKDNSISSLYVINDEEAYIDADVLNGDIKGLFLSGDSLDRRNGIIGNRNYLKRNEFIYITDWNPEKNRKTHSIGWMLDRILHGLMDEDMGSILGIDRDLMDVNSAISSERKAILIKRAIEDTIIPLATKFKVAIEREIGLPSDVRLSLYVNVDFNDEEELINTWNTGTATKKKVLEPLEVDGVLIYKDNPTAVQENVENIPSTGDTLPPDPQISSVDGGDPTVDKAKSFQPIDVKNFIDFNNVTFGGTNNGGLGNDSEIGDKGLVYYIFKRENKYMILALDPVYDGPDAQAGDYTGWSFRNEDIARKVTYLLNELKDPLSGKFLIELVEEYLYS